MDPHASRRSLGPGVMVVATVLLITMVAGVVTPAITLGSSGEVQRGEEIFSTKCAGCHTIGGGKLVGPDLKGVVARQGRDWVVSYVEAPDKVRASGDPKAQQLIKEYGGTMPNLGLSSADAEAVVNYLQAQSGEKPGSGEAAEGQATPPAAASPTATGPAGDPEEGEELFTGEDDFAKGGPPCISCHSASGLGVLGGGTLAADLTGAYSKYGDAGLTSILKTTPFPVMKEAYASRPLTDQEVADLKAFLAQSKGQSEPFLASWGFPLIGLAGFAVLLGIIHLVWHRRLTGVRRKIAGEERR